MTTSRAPTLRTRSRAVAPPAARGLPSLLALAAAGCTFIIEPPEPPPGSTFLVPFTCLPTRVDPVTGTLSVGGGDEPPAPVVHVVFAARVRRSAATLAATWDQFMRETVAGLTATGAQVSVAALLPLDEGPRRGILAAWGCDLDQPDALPAEEVLRFWAAQPPPPGEPRGCALDPVVEAGARWAALSTDYPPGLDGRSGRSVFGEAPDLLLVVHLDPLARRAGADEPACRDAAGAYARQAPDGSAPWVRYAEGPLSGPLAADRIVHWFAYTEEGIDDATLAARCRAQEAFPLGLFDALEASPRALYGPVAGSLSSGPGLVQQIPMCELLVQRRRLEFLRASLEPVAARLGLSVNLDLLSALVDGERLGPPGGDESDEGS